MLEAAVLVTKLEVLGIMYRDLVKKSVGTVTIESEMMRQVHERESGPTGHRMIAVPRKCDKQSEKECELGEKRESSDSQCWREPKIVRKLLSLRKKVVTTQLIKAKKVLRRELGLIAARSSKQETTKARAAVQEVSGETWRQMQPQHQRKVQHLTRRAEECDKHRVCRKLDKIWKEKMIKCYQSSSESTPDNRTVSEDGQAGGAGAGAGGGLGSRRRTQDPPAPGHEGKASTEDPPAPTPGEKTWTGHGPEVKNRTQVQTQHRLGGEPVSVEDSLAEAEEWVEELVSILQTTRRRHVLDMFEDESNGDLHNNQGAP